MLPPDAYDAARLHDMLTAARLAIDYCRGRVRDDLDSNTMMADALIRRIQIIGDAAREISEAFQAAHPEIAWEPITATRHILVHEYGDVNHNTVWRIAHVHLPPLIEQIEAILAESPPPPIQES